MFYTVVSLLSEATLLDTIAALGIMICWYYGITAFACVWYFRRELFSSVHNVVFKFLFPLLGGHHARPVFVISVKREHEPGERQRCVDRRNRTGVLHGLRHPALGAVLMLIMRAHSPDFFVGRTLTRTVAPPEEQPAALPTQG